MTSGRATGARTRFGSPTKHMQLRYLKAALVFGCSTAVVTIAFAVLYQSLFCDDPSFESISARARLGYAWTLAAPMTILAAMVIGMVFIHDSSRAHVIGGRSESGMRDVLLDHLSAATTIVTSVIMAHPLQVLAAFTINLACSAYPAVTRNDLPLHSFIIANIWCTSYVAWVAPFVAAVTDLHASLGSALRAYVAQTLARADNHVVIAGYGDLGRRVLRMLYATDELNIAKYENTWDITMPDGSRGFVICDLTVVDSDVNLFAFTARSGDVQVGLVRLSQMLTRTSSAQEADYYAYGICGDIKNLQVFEVARIASARNFLCLVRDPAAVYAVSDHIKRVQGVRSRAREGTMEVVEAPEHWYREGQRCRCIVTVDSLAPRLFLAHRSFRHSLVLIDVAQLRAAQIAQAAASHLAGTLGRRRRILVLSDTAHAFDFIDEYAKVERSVFSITVLGHADEFKLRRKPGHKSRLIVGRRVSATEVTDERDTGRQQRLRVHYLESSATSPEVVRSAIERSRPDIVVVMQHDATSALDVARAVVVASARMRDCPPMLLAAETGRAWRALSLGDAALHHTQVIRRESARLAFPRNYGASDHRDGIVLGDSIVDVLDDPASRILGVFQAQRQDDPTEMALCLRNTTGSLVQVLNSLAGLQAVQSGLERVVPTFSGVRVSVGPGETVFITSLCNLAGARPKGQPIRRAALLPLGQDGNRISAMVVRPFGLTDDGRRWGAPTSWATRGCPRMESCPAAQHCTSAEVRMAAGKRVLSPYYWADDGESGAVETAEDEAPTAKVSVVGTHGRQPGAIANILNAMLFCVPTRAPDAQNLVNIFGLTIDPCHERKYAVATLYGAAVVRTDVQRPAMESLAVDIVIRPRASAAAWVTYATELVVFLRQQWGISRACAYSFAARLSDGTEQAEPFVIWATTRPRPMSYVYSILRGGPVDCETCSQFGPCRLCIELRGGLERTVHVDQHPEVALTIKVLPDERATVATEE